jgi:outer membrane protein OmpU
MNKLTKIGASALCGSLAAISAANAGDLSVTGGVDMSWISKPKDVVGNPIGIGSNLTFSGSGELDNGWTVALSVADTNKAVYSNTNVTVTIPGVGDIRIDQGVSGTGIDRMDDMTPNVWEEAYGTGLAGGPNTVSGVSGGANIEITPSMTPDGLTARVSWSPDAGGSAGGDKGSAESSGSVKGSGYSVTVEASSDFTGMDGLTLYGGMARVDQHQNSTGINDDIDEWTAGIKYAVGGFTLGYQYSKEDTGRATTNTEYQNDAYGVTFQVNDNLSIGYNNYKSEQESTTNTELEASSIQVAYSMGGVSVRLADASIDNQNYTTGAGNQRDATTLSIALAF